MEDETKNEPTQQQEQTPEPQAKTYSEEDRKSTRLNSSHANESRMPSSA